MRNDERKEFWELKDEYIEKRRAGMVVHIQDYCNRPYLDSEEKQELREQLEEYEASQTGLIKLEAAVTWDRISSEFRIPIERSVAASTSGDFGSIPVEVLDERGEIVEILDFLLETDLEVDQDGELVFSAVTSDDRFSGEKVFIKICDEEREYGSCSPTIGGDRRIEVFLDLSHLGTGIKTDRSMIKAMIRSTCK